MNLKYVSHVVSVSLGLNKFILNRKKENDENF